jgi:hypothetical protein
MDRSMGLTNILYYLFNIFKTNKDITDVKI